MSAWAHSHGIRLLRYLDDWLVLASSEREAKQAVQSLLSLCHTLGIVINEKKSDLVPSQTAKYLGMTIDTEAGKVFPSLARVEKFLTVAESFCTMDAPLAQLWQVILGHLASLKLLVPHGRPRMRSLQWHPKARWSPESDPPSLPVALPREVKRDLSWWMVRDHLLTGFRFGTPAPDLHLYSDASCLGWGAHLLDQHVSGVWSDQEKLLHINLLEMKALFLGLQSFREDVIGRHVTAMCDNSTVVAYVNKQGGTVSRALCLLASRLLRWTESLDIHLDARYLPGQANVLADLLSRHGQVVGTEWSLHPQVGMSLLRFWGNPSIDFFATSLNVKLTLYCSLVPDPQAVFEDAFRHPWDDLDLYAFPLIGRVVARVRESSRLAMTGRTPLAREGVVRRPGASTDPTTSCPALVGQSASAAPLQPLPPRRPLAEPPRVATLKRHLRKSGFSGRARAAAQSLAIPPRCDVFSLHSHSGLSAPDACTPTSSSGVSPSGVSDRARLLGRLLPEGSSVVVSSLPSGCRGGLSSSSSGTASIYRRVRCGVGRVSPLRPPVRLVVLRCFSIFDQPPRASGRLPCHPGFSPSPPGQVGVSLHRQYVRSFIPPQGRGHSLLDTQFFASASPTMFVCSPSLSRVASTS